MGLTCQVDLNVFYVIKASTIQDDKLQLLLLYLTTSNAELWSFLIGSLHLPHAHI